MKRILYLPILAWLALLVASVCLAQPAAAILPVSRQGGGGQCR